MTDDLVKQALAELGDMVRCHCDEAYRDRGLHDPQCHCDSADAVKVVTARIEELERERVLDAKLLADTQALLDKAVDALRRIADAADRKHVGGIACAVLAEIEGGVEATEDVGILRARVDELQRLNADLTRQVQMQPRRPQDAAPATDAVDALVKAAVEAERERCAKIADRYHAQAMEWVKSQPWLKDHTGETDSSRIAAAIREGRND